MVIHWCLSCFLVLAPEVIIKCVSIVSVPLLLLLCDAPRWRQNNHVTLAVHSTDIDISQIA